MSLARRPANSSIFFQATERIVNTIPSTKDHRFVPTGANELYCIQKKKGGEQQPTAKSGLERAPAGIGVKISERRFLHFDAAQFFTSHAEVPPLSAQVPFGQ